MKVTRLEVSNLLSFREFELDLNDRLTVLVGPNGAGKTNLARVLDLVSKLVDWADERSRSGAAPPTPSDAVLSSYLQARHDQSAPEGPIEVRLEVDMCEPAERARITAFVRAAMPKRRHHPARNGFGQVNALHSDDAADSAHGVTWSC